ncbi:MAG: hypothetical protein ACI857_000352 [Arenicella sp.]|jgi:hypothetical protein
MPFAILIAILITVGLYLAFKKILASYGQKTRQIILILIPVIIYSALNTYAGKLYIVNVNENTSLNRIIGSKTVETGGESFVISVPFNEVGLLNYCNEDLVIEKVRYSSHSLDMGYDSEPAPIPAHSFSKVFLSRGLIDYFLNDDPPDRIKTSFSSSEVRYHLRVDE